MTTQVGPLGWCVEHYPGGHLRISTDKRTVRRFDGAAWLCTSCNGMGMSVLVPNIAA